MKQPGPGRPGAGDQRLRVVIRGAVQGVGYRPFVYRLAMELELRGWVCNSSGGLIIEVEGSPERLDTCQQRLHDERPPRAFVQGIESAVLDPAGYRGFEIRLSDASERKTTFVLPDVATCDDCLAELFDPADRRHLYPFTNCTHCGPRFSIVERLPYDRPATTMRRFRMCPRCDGEYHDPLDRRFHAQPNACPECGPQLELWDAGGKQLATRHEGLLVTAQALGEGRIVAVKGLGGFHLMVDARNGRAVQRLRERKNREEKPLALMVPSVEAAQDHVSIDAAERRLLCSPEAPIVLLERRAAREAAEVADEVAPGNPSLGVVLPYTPLHHLLLREIGFPVVATSGNLSDEPICTDEQEALQRLAGIADLFLVHDRPIARHVDDSVARVVAGRPMLLRRARGYAPLPVSLKRPLPPTLAVGGQLKNSVALAIDRNAFLSQHIGDLETAQALGAFHDSIEALERLYETTPEQLACDLHPDYASTLFAERRGLPVEPVQHHHAHVAACLAENEIEPPVLGVAWDGTGHGDDGTVWGGEFLVVEAAGYRRAAHFRTFRLPGGERAIKEPRRSALGLLHELYGPGLRDLQAPAPLAAFPQAELPSLLRMLERGLNAPLTSSAGRLFDAVAGLLGLRQRCSFEGQAAMELEFAAQRASTEDRLAVRLLDPGSAEPSSPIVVDWEPMVTRLIELAGESGDIETPARMFHNTLAAVIVEVAQRVGLERVALSGGCFQNRLLTETAICLLREAGFRPYWHQRVPPNDGCIALGQLAVLALRDECENGDTVFDQMS